MRFKAALLLSSLSPLVALAQPAKAQVASPRDLVRSLTYESDRPGKASVVKGFFSCGQLAPDREAATALAKLGDPAIPDIENALDASGRGGGSSNLGFEWLALAYAKIQGPKAYARLRWIAKEAKVESAVDVLDPAIALALSLSSYVSASRARVRIIRCRGDVPRDALDQLILAWEANDPSWLTPTLGPNAKAALDSLMKGSTWEKMRADLWKAGPNDDLAVGYKFNCPGYWSEPEETLAATNQYWNRESNPRNPEIKTTFTNSAGIECGTLRVDFASNGQREEEFLVDNSDLGHLAALSARNEGAATVLLFGSPFARVFA